jgi:aspartate kinase
VFRAVADADVNIDMIVQVGSYAGDGRADISFTLPKTDGRTALAVLDEVREKIGFERTTYDEHIGKLSLIGAGMKSHPGVSARFFGALADAGVNVEIISTSEIRISVVVRDADLPVAVRAVHGAFELGDPDQAAVVYAGTGR